MKESSSNGRLDEEKLVKAYMDVTGASELAAKSVFMFLASEDGETAEQPERAAAGGE